MSNVALIYLFLSLFGLACIIVFAFRTHLTKRPQLVRLKLVSVSYEQQMELLQLRFDEFPRLSFYQQWRQELTPLFGQKTTGSRIVDVKKDGRFICHDSHTRSCFYTKEGSRRVPDSRRVPSSS
jgi:hypothetical protein